jgi:undecaprenyl diphosphate synthase
MRAPQKTPQHIAIIMDGNGRWAKEKGLPRISGHRAGIDRVREIVRAAGKIGVKVLTLYAFSAENWSRPKMEIRALMGYLDRFLNKELAELNKNNVRLVFLGRGEPLPEGLLRKMRAA